MKYKQLIYPNLDDDKSKPLYVYNNGKMLTDWCGWCLAVVKAAYGATKSMGTALNAWNCDKTQHKDKDFPEGLYIPAYFSGDKDNYGHVVILKRTGNNIKVWSSPYTHKPYYDTFSGSIDSVLSTIIKKYGLKQFLGWTEFVCEKRVIDVVNEPAQDPEPSKDPEPAKDPDPAQEPEPFTPADPADAGTISDLISEASGVFEPSNTVKLIAYLIGDLFLVAALLIPDIVNAIQAPTLTVWAEYMSKIMLEAGTSILLIFKLIKKK